MCTKLSLLIEGLVMYLLLHLKNGTLKHHYEGDYSSLATIDKECEIINEKYMDEIDFIELVLEEDLNE